MGYDIVGDVHGQAAKLEGLLRKLGYRPTAGSWRHHGRQAIFVGDFIDNGPASVQSVETVRGMVDAGDALAVMGNHELNAVAWHTPDPHRPGAYLRSHDSAKHRKQLARFLAEVEDQPALQSEIVDWFLTLPLWLDLPGLRVVHACWHPRLMAWLAPQLRDERYLTRDLLVAATNEPQDEARGDYTTPSISKAVECVTEGIEVPLPGGQTFRARDGSDQSRVRVRWWDLHATTYVTAALRFPGESLELPDVEIPNHARVPLEDTPVFFGHYRLAGTPSIEFDRYVCLDYGAADGEPLVAYRFDGESDLSSERFVWVA